MASFNSDSKQKIVNVVNNARNHPMYQNYEISSYCGDWRTGVQIVDISKNGDTINQFHFYPGINGEIQSIAIYGSNLRGHLNAILSSMSIFGMPVESAEMDSGYSDYVDVYLKN